MATTAASTEHDRLRDAYQGAGRHYHDVSHVEALLSLTQAHRTVLIDPTAVDLAVYYHDVVYDPARRDNEALSAVFARESLTRLGLPQGLVEKLALYVEATAHLAPSVGLPPGEHPDLDHFLDFDLSILAAPAAEYDSYAAAIRREYAIYPEADYARGRAAVLKKLLASPALYRMPALAAAWEPAARANMARELGRLEPA